MKNFWMLCMAVLLCVTGCSRYEQMSPYATTPAPIVVERTKMEADTTEAEAEMEELPEIYPLTAAGPKQTPDQVKGIYISAYAAGTSSVMAVLLDEIERTEINAVVIDLKGDEGYITCRMDSPIVKELGSVKRYIPDIDTLMAELKANGVYTIARVAAFRDPLMAERRPEWCVQNADGTVFKDNSGMAWINPYIEETWDYLVEIGVEARALGFDEVQFDYIRFCTERGMNNVVFEESDVRGRSRTDVITEFMRSTYARLKNEGLVVSADVFGAIISSGVDAKSLGQVYGEMARYLDYISPMIYPSHYADGNFGIDHPDTQPYDTIMAALAASKKQLEQAAADGSHIAEVRPWLQDFTASYLKNYIPYEAPEVRAQIQAAYDSGYDDWLLWNASARYSWDGLLTPEAAKNESRAIAESRRTMAEQAAQAGSSNGAAAVSDSGIPETSPQ